MADEDKIAVDIAPGETWKKLSDYRWRRSSGGFLFQNSTDLLMYFTMEQRSVCLETGESLWEPVPMVPE